MNKKLPFYKMSGSGNDFILIDNRQGLVQDESLEELIVGACRRRMSVGADGLILIEESRQADFRWRFYNADGSRAEMCGNGARCAARFAYLTGIAGRKLSFETDVGRVGAEVIENRVRIRMTDPNGLRMNQKLVLDEIALNYDFINTGVPHVVISVDINEHVDVVNTGRTIRNHPHFAPAGSNVNFIQPIDDHTISVRTYERGVEDETLACGTGCVAASLVMALRHDWVSPIHVKTRSGEMLQVYYQLADNNVKQVHLEGDARLIYEGRLWKEAWKTP